MKKRHHLTLTGKKIFFEREEKPSLREMINEWKGYYAEHPFRYRMFLLRTSLELRFNRFKHKFLPWFSEPVNTSHETHAWKWLYPGLHPYISRIVKRMRREGFDPLYYTRYAFEHTFIFQTADEAMRAASMYERDLIQAWWYGLDEIDEVMDKEKGGYWDLRKRKVQDLHNKGKWVSLP